MDVDIQSFTYLRVTIICRYIFLRIWFRASFARTTGNICDLYAEMIKDRHFLMKVFDHIPVAEYNGRLKKQVRMVKDRLNTCACMPTQSVVGKGSLRIYTWSIQQGCSSSVKVKRYFKSIRWIYM